MSYEGLQNSLNVLLVAFDQPFHFHFIKSLQSIIKHLTRGRGLQRKARSVIACVWGGPAYRQAGCNVKPGGASAAAQKSKIDLIFHD
jgi:hypothetical protein